MVEMARQYYFVNDLHRLRSFETLRWLGVHPNEHRHVGRDIGRAYAMASIFFDDGDGFFESGVGKQWKGTLLTDQSKRAESFPDIRSHTSCKYRPDDFYKDMSRLGFDRPISTEEIRKRFPPDWNIALRPIIARRE